MGKVAHDTRPSSNRVLVLTVTSTMVFLILLCSLYGILAEGCNEDAIEAIQEEMKMLRMEHSQEITALKQVTASLEQDMVKYKRTNEAQHRLMVKLLNDYSKCFRTKKSSFIHTVLLCDGSVMFGYHSGQC